MRRIHACPRCRTNTTEKCYCLDCRAVLKKPPMVDKASFRPDYQPWRENGKLI